MSLYGISSLRRLTRLLCRQQSMWRQGYTRAKGCDPLYYIVKVRCL